MKTVNIFTHYLITWCPPPPKLPRQMLRFAPLDTAALHVQITRFIICIIINNRASVTF